MERGENSLNAAWELHAFADNTSVQNDVEQNIQLAVGFIQFENPSLQEAIDNLPELQKEVLI